MSYKIKDLKFWCQRVLPLVYDDSLSFMELLYKVIKKVNEVIELTNNLNEQMIAEVDRQLQEWLDDGTLGDIITEAIADLQSQIDDLESDLSDAESDITGLGTRVTNLTTKVNKNTADIETNKWFYVPEEFDAVGDGVADDTEALSKAMKRMRDTDIKYLFIPPKTYRTTKTLAIPAGCTVFGTGIASKIYWDETSTGFGAALMNGGNHVSILDLCVNHLTQGPITFSAQTGAVGITTFTNCAGAVDSPSSESRADTHNIYIQNLYTNQGRYCLQCEPDPDHQLYDVIVDGVHATNALVSMISRDNKLRNISYRNIQCEALRIGGNDSVEIGTEILVEQFRTKYLRVNTQRAVVRNGYVKCDTTINHNEDHAVMVSGGVEVSDLYVVGGNANVTYAIKTNRRGTLPVIFNNVNISGFEYLLANLFDVFHIDFNDCEVDWANSARPDVKGIINGRDFKVINSQYPLIYNDVTMDITSIIPFTTAHLTPRVIDRITVTGHLMQIRAARSLNNLPSSNALLNIPADQVGRLRKPGESVLVYLLDSNLNIANVTCASFNSENYGLILDDTSLTLSNYAAYLINDTVEIMTP